MTAHPPSRTRARVLALGVLACLPSQGIAAAAGAPARKTPLGRKAPAPAADYASEFASAVGLYENFDYEHALEAFNKAKALAKGMEQEVPVSLYLGIVYAELGNHEQSLAAFRTALYLQPEAKLPVKVSPRVQSDFDDVRKAVVRDLGLEPAPVVTAPPPPPATPATPPPASGVTPPAPGATPPAVAATDAPVSPPVARAPDLTAPSQPAAPAGAYMPALHAESSRRNTTLPLVLLGTAAVTGGGAVFFGLQSRNEVANARGDLYYDTRTKDLASAQRNAFVANVLIGTASAAALLGALTYFFMPGSAPAPTASGGASP